MEHMLDKALIRALHSFRNAHDSVGFINMRKAPFFLHFTHLLEAAPQSWVLKLEIISVTSCYSSLSHGGWGCSKGNAMSGVFSLWSCSGDVSRAGCSELLLSSPALLWRPLRCSLQWTFSLRQKQRNKGIKIELGTSHWHHVQLQFSLPKLSVEDLIQGGEGICYLATRYFWLMQFKNMK